MMSRPPKHEFIQLRVTLEQKRAMQKAALMRGQTLSEMLRDFGRRAA